MYRVVAAIVVLAILGCSPSQAQPSAPPGFEDAQRAFNTQLDLNARVLFQVAVISAGYLNAVPTETFSLRLFNGLKRLQAENGLSPTGSLDRDTVDKVFELGLPMLRMWRFQKVAPPGRPVSIWMPTGLGLRPEINRNGITYADPAGRVRASLSHYSGTDLPGFYSSILAKTSEQGLRVNYKVIKDGWFVVSTTSPSGTDGYLRYHSDDDGVTGFSAFWTNSAGNVSGERIAILMSASLGSRFSGNPFIDPPAIAEPQTASRPAPVPPPGVPPAGVPPAGVPLSPAPRAEPAQTQPPESVTGTGFFVAETGEFVTNAHVVPACRNGLYVKMSNGQFAKAEVIARDATNDLALLRVTGKPPRVAVLRVSARLGENVAVFEFPHTDILSTSGNFTTGIITASQGMKDDTRFYQTSAPIQAGNSGGPMVDGSGNVVGVVTSKLNALRVALADGSSGDLVQNVNFAVKTALLTTFLEASGTKFQTGAAAEVKLDTPDLADVAKAISGFVICQ